MFDYIERELGDPDKRNTPEGMLVVAILARAAADIRHRFIRDGKHGIFSVTKGKNSTYLHSRDAFNFFHSRIFRAYCDLIDADATAIRDAILFRADKKGLVFAFERFTAQSKYRSHPRYLIARRARARNGSTP